MRPRFAGYGDASENVNNVSYLLQSCTRSYLNNISDGEIWRPLPDEDIQARHTMGWDEVGREKNKPSERGAMKWRAGKARCVAVTTTCVYCHEDDNECMVYLSYIVAWQNRCYTNLAHAPMLSGDGEI